MSSTLSFRRPTPPALHVPLVGDSDLIRSILRELLGRLGGCQVVGEDVTAAGSITGFRKLRLEVALLDLELKTGTGLDMLHEIGPEPGKTRVFVVTDYVDEAFRERSMAYGASDFYDKSRDMSRLLSDLAAMAARRAGDLGRKTTHDASRPNLCASDFLRNSHNEKKPGQP